MVVVAVAVVSAVVVVSVVAVVVAAVIMDRGILVHHPRTILCVSSMARPTPRASTVDGTVATVPIHQAAMSYPA